MPSSRKRIFTEALNSAHGYYYTVNKSLYRGRSKFQKLELVDTDEFGRVLLLDDITQVSENKDHEYHEPMVHPALITHPRPSRVLVIGGGDGGIVREVLKYKSVNRIDFAELDEKVVSFSRRYLADMNKGSFDDPRVTIHITDGRAFVENHPGRFDVVIMDMTDPFGPSKMLYTREFFTAVKNSFRNTNGIFVMHSESPVTRPLAYSCIHKTLGKVFPRVRPFYLFIQMYATLWSISVCSMSADPATLDASAVKRRIASRGIKGLRVYSGDTHCAMQAAFPWIESLHRTGGRIITDRRPDFPDNFIDSR